MSHLNWICTFKWFIQISSLIRSVMGAKRRLFLKRYFYSPSYKNLKYCSQISALLRLLSWTVPFLIINQNQRANITPSRPGASPRDLLPSLSLRLKTGSFLNTIWIIHWLFFFFKVDQARMKYILDKKINKFKTQAGVHVPLSTSRILTLTENEYFIFFFFFFGRAEASQENDSVYIYINFFFFFFGGGNFHD